MTHHQSSWQFFESTSITKGTSNCHPIFINIRLQDSTISLLRNFLVDLIQNVHGNFDTPDDLESNLAYLVVFSPKSHLFTMIQSSTWKLSEYKTWTQMWPHGCYNMRYEELNCLERILDGRDEPKNLKLPLLELITENFSSGNKVGRGGCGEGILPNGRFVAVKRLFKSHTIDEKMFNQEVKSMLVAKHRNIVRFLGYCSDTQGKAIPMEGDHHMAEERESGYCAPEYLHQGKMSNKSDIYSLGIIIGQVVTGSKEKPDVTKLSPCLEHMLGVEPLEIHFPLALDKEISCSVELTNDTDDYIAFMVSTTSLLQFRTQPKKDIIPPRSKCCVIIAVQAQENAPLNYQTDFYVHSTTVDETLTAKDITDELFDEEEGHVVDEVNLPVVFDVLPPLP
ncbi:hypothetical protein PR202_gb16368 [Eleusine coracana subsp. coracana]|uniref:MSP domain-containing protein n=1 Tax=Eleusine coracana subsp. coracana TaxID=191504 RepID=A0AAV5F074_ELECO|nr:hypothetical protein PR202_gb16368 [Eleusine coracana subsp. coracana]